MVNGYTHQAEKSSFVEPEVRGHRPKNCKSFDIGP
jgi:hypothetical protein